MRVLIVGAGSIGRRHLRNLRALAPGCEIAAFRAAGARGEELAEEFRWEVVGSLSDGIACAPSFAVISNPPALHIAPALELARAGVPLFIEKPLSDRMEGIEELKRIVAEKRLPCLVAFNLRFHPGLRRIRALLDEGRIGRPLSIRAEVGQYLPDWRPGEDYREGYTARRALGGGVILDLIHELDCARWLMGEVKRVSCFAGRVSRLEMDAEDVAEINLEFESGALGNVHLDCLQRAPSRLCRIFGEEGTILWDYHANEVRIHDVRTGSWEAIRDEAFVRNDMFLDEMRHFLNCLEGKETPLVDVEEGARVLRLALAARESAESGRAVEVGVNGELA